MTRVRLSRKFGTALGASSNTVYVYATTASGVQTTDTPGYEFIDDRGDTEFYKNFIEVVPGTFEAYTGLAPYDFRGGIALNAVIPTGYIWPPTDKKIYMQVLTPGGAVIDIIEITLEGQAGNWFVTPGTIVLTKRLFLLNLKNKINF